MNGNPRMACGQWQSGTQRAAVGVVMGVSSEGKGGDDEDRDDLEGQRPNEQFPKREVSDEIRIDHIRSYHLRLLRLFRSDDEYLWGKTGKNPALPAFTCLTSADYSDSSIKSVRKKG